MKDSKTDMPRRTIAWIETVSEERASGELKRAYRRSADPASLIDHLHLYKTLMYGDSPLSRIQREMIGVVASAPLPILTATSREESPSVDWRQRLDSADSA